MMSMMSMMCTIIISTTFLALYTLCACSAKVLEASSCAEVLIQGNTKSGVYNIFPRAWFKSIPFEVFCDMKTNGGGWTVFQRRDDYEPTENFFRNWQDYKSGFGDLEKDFWLGNEHLFVLANQDEVEIRIDLEDFDGTKKWAQYKHFRIANENYLYNISITEFSGDAGDSMINHNKQIFATFDKDNPHNAANLHKGGWWYTGGYNANLNGLYLKGKTETWEGIEWQGWYTQGKYSLKKSEMKIRPTNFLFNPCSQ